MTDKQLVIRFNSLRKKHNTREACEVLAEELFYSPSYIEVLVRNASRRCGIKKYATKREGAPKCRECKHLRTELFGTKGRKHYYCTIEGRQINPSYAVTCSPSWCVKRKEEENNE